MALQANYISGRGDVQKLELKGDRDDIEEILTEVRSGKLVIRNRSNSWFGWSSTRGLEIYVTVRELESLNLSGSGKAYGENKITSDYLELKVSGSGSMDLKADAKETDIMISGSGKVYLSGEGDRSHVAISGSGSVRAENFKANSFKIRISGSGSCEIHAVESIDSRISGSGSVRYKGDPRNVNASSSGSGKVRKM